MKGFLRNDGRKGIRNVHLVVYLVECAHHVCDRIQRPWDETGEVHVVGFSGCYPSSYGVRMLRTLCAHPNTGAVLLVSLGCESIDHRELEQSIAATGRPVSTIVIQEIGGTEAAIREGRARVERTLAELRDQRPVAMVWPELCVGTICGGSDGTSGVAANPAIGRAFDRLLDLGVTCIFEETGELIGCEHIMAQRAETPEVAEKVIEAVAKADGYSSAMGHGSFSPGNADGGLTTIEEKSLGAYAKSGASAIRGVVKPTEVVGGGGLFLLDVVPDGEPRFGFANINDTSEIVELISCGAHVILFSTGRGSVVGSVVSPVVKVCANPETYERMAGDMDVNAGRVVAGTADLDTVGDEIVALVERIGHGERTKSETLGHQEFVLGYKTFSEGSSGGS